MNMMQPPQQFPGMGDLQHAGIPMPAGLPQFPGGDQQFPMNAPLSVQQSLTPAVTAEQLAYGGQPQQFQPQPQQFQQPQAAFVPPPSMDFQQFPQQQPQFAPPAQQLAPPAPADFAMGAPVAPPMPVAPALPGAPALEAPAAPADGKPTAKVLASEIKNGNHDANLNQIYATDDRATVRKAVEERSAVLNNVSTNVNPAPALPAFDGQSYAAAAPVNPVDVVVYVPVPMTKLSAVLSVL